MQPSHWQPPVELSEQEEQIVNKIRKAKLFVFLRHHRHELLDEAFQQELASLYRQAERGHPPVAPAMLALALILQAYTGVSDDEVIEATVMDRRWQLVLDCLDTEQAPFSKGTLVAFPQRFIEAQLDRRLRFGKPSHRYVAATCGHNYPSNTRPPPEIRRTRKICISKVRYRSILC